MGDPVEELFIGLVTKAGEVDVLLPQWPNLVDLCRNASTVNLGVLNITSGCRVLDL